MVAQNTVRTYGVNHVFRIESIEGIEGVVKFSFFGKIKYFTFYVRNMFWAVNLNNTKFHMHN